MSALSQAAELYQAGQFDAASSSCAQYLQGHPEDHRAHQLMALIRHEMGDRDNAKEHIQQAISLAPDVAAYHANHGAILYAYGQADLAVSAYLRARTSDPTLEGVDAAIGILYNGLNQPKQAIGAFRRALAIKPDDAHLHLNMGSAQRNAGDFADARDSFQTLTQLAPDFADGHYNLGIVQQDLGDHEGAVASLRQAITLAPDIAAYHMALGKSERALGNKAASDAAFREVLQLDPVGETYNLSGPISTIENVLTRGNLARAEQRIRQAMDEFPICPWWPYFRAVIASKLDLRDEMRRWIDAAKQAIAECAPVRFSELENRIATLEATLATAPPAGPHPDPSYLLIKCWGYGFWSDVSHVLASMLLAEMTGRIPVIHWGSNSYYTDTPEEDAFASFYQPPNDLTLKDIALSDADYYPEKWNAGNLTKEGLGLWFGKGSRQSGIYLLNRPEKVVVSDFYTQLAELLPWLGREHPLYGMSVRDACHTLYHQHFKLQPAVQEEVDAFIRPNFTGAPTLGVHIRNIDKGGESVNFEEDRAQILPTVESLLAENPDLRIFLMTDTTDALEEWQRRFGDRVFNADCARTDSKVPLTWRDDVDSHHRLGVEVIRDTYAATACDKFVGLGCTNVVGMVTTLKRWRDEDLHIIGEVSLLRENWLLHDW